MRGAAPAWAWTFEATAASSIASSGKLLITDEKERKAAKPKSSSSSGRPTTSQDARLARLGKPPTWKSALWRAVAATAIFFVILLLAFQQKPGQALALSGFMLLVYIPLGYYTDLMLHRRFLRKQAAARGGKR